MARRLKAFDRNGDLPTVIGADNYSAGVDSVVETLKKYQQEHDCSGDYRQDA